MVTSSCPLASTSSVYVDISSNEVRCFIIELVLLALPTQCPEQGLCSGMVSRQSVLSIHFVCHSMVEEELWHSPFAVNQTAVAWGCSMVLSIRCGQCLQPGDMAKHRLVYHRLVTFLYFFKLHPTFVIYMHHVIRSVCVWLEKMLNKMIFDLDILRDGLPWLYLGRIWTILIIGHSS